MSIVAAVYRSRLSVSYPCASPSVGTAVAEPRVVHAFKRGGRYLAGSQCCVVSLAGFGFDFVGRIS
jgi:hypothetical protein